jgi:outer membrane protein OmpA-like peptidoglycan-associated protein
MAFKNKLLATAAIPLIAFVGMTPVSAMTLPRPAASVEAKSDIITVQSEEELLQQQKQERREKRRNRQNEGEAQQQNDGGQQVQQEEEQQPRRKRRNDAEAQQQDDGAQQVQQEEEQQPRRKRRNNAEAQQQDDSVQDVQQQEEEPVKPRRKRQNAESQEAQPEDSVQQTQQEEEQQPRRKKRDNAEQQQDGDVQQTQQDDSEPVKPRRKKQNAEQQDNSGETQQGESEETQPRRKQKNNAAASEDGPSDEEIRKALEEHNQGVGGKKRNKQNDAAGQDETGGQQQNAAEDNGSNGDDAELPRKKKRNQQADESQPGDEQQAVTPKNAEEKKVIAADPSKTTDTVELPVENGAAVLDSDKDADKGGDKARERRKREREEVKEVKVPESDEDAQADLKGKKRIVVKPVLDEKGERLTGFKGYDDLGGRRVDKRDDDTRVIINIDGRIVIRGDDDRRLGRDSDTRYERLSDGRIREIVIRPDGDRIITVRNRYGEIIRRSRIDRDDREIVIFYSPDLERGRDRLFLRDPGEDLPPMRLRIPVDEYIIDVSSNQDRDYEEFLEQPPVEPVERVYSVDEVKYSARIRDKMRRIDLDTITFDTGSAEISTDQTDSLKEIGAALKDMIDRDPGETFLIEGHTDAVGSDESNLVLSDSRAESVASVLSDIFNIPPENLVTQGYGERYLKIDTDGDERENRRVTIRRITPLVRPVASAE